MSYTYTQDVVTADPDTDFVPAYARKTVKPKKVRTWMVLAPIAGLALIGGAVAMLMTSGGGDAQPLVEPAAAPAVVTPMHAVVASTPAVSLPADASSAKPVAAIRAPVTRRMRVERRAEAAPHRPAPPRAEAPAEPTGPSPYQASPMTPTPRIAPSPMVTPAPAPATPSAASLSVAPLT